MGDSRVQSSNAVRWPASYVDCATSANRTIQEIAAILECSPGKISRIETGSVGARLGDVTRPARQSTTSTASSASILLDLVRQSHRRLVARVCGLCCRRSRSGSSASRTARPPSRSTAACWCGAQQTRHYLRALIGTARGGPEHRGAPHELRRRRRELLVRDNAPPSTFVMARGRADRSGRPALR